MQQAADLFVEPMSCRVSSLAVPPRWSWRSESVCLIRASSDGRCGGLGGDSERSRCSAAEGRAGAVAGERAAIEKKNTCAE